jgi:hypothetical protein
VVTSFELELHPLGPDVAVAMVFYPYDDAEQILRRWPDVVRAMPDTVTPELALWSVPPDPSIPAGMHGAKVVIVQGVYAGPADRGGRDLAPLQTLATPLIDASGTMPYVAIQSSLDELFPAGGRYYMKSHFMDELDDGAIAAILDHDARRPTPSSLIVIRSLGGAVSRVGADESAYPHRSARFNVSIDAGWTDPRLDDAAIAWARRAWDALQPFATGGVYINFSGLDEEADRLRGAVFGRSQQRLADVREAYDRDGLFSGAARRP